jgi:hypothetical protein
MDKERIEDFIDGLTKFDRNYVLTQYASEAQREVIEFIISLAEEKESKVVTIEELRCMLKQVIRFMEKI